MNAEENITRTFSYTLNITRLQATDVNVIIPAGTEAEIVNAAGGVIQPLICGEVVDGVYVNTYALKEPVFPYFRKLHGGGRH